LREVSGLRQTVILTLTLISIYSVLYVGTRSVWSWVACSLRKLMQLWVL